jgi:CRISPR-associated protein Cas5t
MLCLRVKAAFAAFRPLAAGSYRVTAPFITPSAAYGLALNVAGIESRRDDGSSTMTLTAVGLPTTRIAIGAVRLPEVQTLYQQLHNYPVGATGRERADDSKGNKYNIQPVRREILSGIDGYICLDGNQKLEGRVREGLRLGNMYTPEGKVRYGIPFLGDNNFLLSMLRQEIESVPAYWFQRVEPSDSPGGEISRLTVWIDRRDMSRTITYLYRRPEVPSAEIPDTAWATIPPASLSRDAL